MTTVKVDIPDDQAATLKAKAMAQGLTLEGWFQRIAAQEAPVGGDESVVQEMPFPESVRFFRARLCVKHQVIAVHWFNGDHERILA